MQNEVKGPSSENIVNAISGWPMLFVNILVLLIGITIFVTTIFGASHGRVEGETTALRLFCSAFLEVLAVILLTGHFTLQPNEARVLILFGAYKGTVRRSGFYWANPFYSRSRMKIPVGTTSAGGARNHKGTPMGSAEGGILYRSVSAKISLRAHNFNSDKVKVNDKRGNPIEIAAVVVWRVENTAQAAFDVEDYESYIQVQSETAIRHTASLYSYDQGEENETTLRGGGDEVARELVRELQSRLAKAGVVVDEARITHLAYAPEIAQAMLRRQQAEAVIAARQKIVHGAVSMVEMALRELAEREVVKLDDERRAAMVSNLLVVLCGESEATPVINTGTLYN